MKSFDSRFCHPSIPLVATFRSWLSLALGTAAILLVACQAPDARALSVGQMTVNGRANPLGIAADDISFAWAIAAAERGCVAATSRSTNNFETRVVYSTPHSSFGPQTQPRWG